MIAMERMTDWIRLAAAVTCLLLLATCAAAEGTTKVIVDDVIPRETLLVPTQRITSMIKTKPGPNSTKSSTKTSALSFRPSFS